MDGTVGRHQLFCSFFFSSRRRHTRSLRDWSSDVCSSDLPFRDRGMIVGATQANPVVITTASPHGLTTGAHVAIDGVVGMTELNGFVYTITVLSPTTFRLNGENGTGYGAYVSGGSWDVRGTIAAASQGNPVAITSASPHGLVSGDHVTIDNVVGMTELNGRTFAVTVLSPTTFSLDGENGTAHTAYISGGDWWTADQYRIPAQPDRGIWLGLSSEVDRSAGTHRGRIYVAFADQADRDGQNDYRNSADHNDTDVFVIFSDDHGLAWSAPVRAN